MWNRIEVRAPKLYVPNISSLLSTPLSSMNMWLWARMIALKWPFLHSGVKW